MRFYRADASHALRKNLRSRKRCSMCAFQSLSRTNVLTRLAILTASVLTACEATSDSDEDVRGRAVVIDRRTDALLAPDLKSINGTYEGCTARSGNWSLPIAGGVPLDYPELTVVREDSACMLRVTELRTTEGVLAANPSFFLDTSYQSSASSFGSPIQFYANAMASSLGFFADFTVTVLYSDDPALAVGGKTADYAVHGASASALSVPAPNYSLYLDGIHLEVDAHNRVVDTWGSADLYASGVHASEYVVVRASGLNTYAQLDAAFNDAAPDGFWGSVDVYRFDLLGEDLTHGLVRTLILANIENGVRAYQAFEITFNKPYIP